MTNFTVVKIVKTQHDCHHRLRFGAPVEQIALDKNSSLACFKPQQIFGYIRWTRNVYGTRSWQLFVVRAVQGGRVTRIPGIHPGADTVFRARGVVATKRTLQWLDALEKSVPYDLSELPESFWRQAQNIVLTKRKYPVFDARVNGLCHV